MIKFIHDSLLLILQAIETINYHILLDLKTVYN